MNDMLIKHPFIALLFMVSLLGCVDGDDESPDNGPPNNSRNWMVQPVVMPTMIP